MWKKLGSAHPDVRMVISVALILLMLVMAVLAALREEHMRGVPPPVPTFGLVDDRVSVMTFCNR